MPRKAKASERPAKKETRTPRQSKEDVQGVLNEIKKSVDAGSTIKDALAQAGVSYSNYNYWRKRAGLAPSRRSRKAAAKVGSSRKGSVTTILQEMTENRAERQRLQDVLSHIKQLDARFRVLAKQLLKAGN
jgi:hypothetical protein